MPTLIEEYSAKMGAFSPYDWALQHAKTLYDVADIMVEYYKADEEFLLDRMHLHKFPESRCRAQDKLKACRTIHETMEDFLRVGLVFGAIATLSITEIAAEESVVRLTIRAAKRRVILAAARLSRAAAEREYAQFLYKFHDFDDQAD